jgi:DNA-binding MarR family transcriptional regulator
VTHHHASTLAAYARPTAERCACCWRRRLELAGLVERRPDPNDRRGKLIALTDAGKRVIDETIGRHVANEERLLSVLTPAEQEKLNALLRKLIAGL